jgi:succinoglycan biosynthesis transport protein ExoP
MNSVPPFLSKPLPLPPSGTGDARILHSFMENLGFVLQRQWKLVLGSIAGALVVALLYLMTAVQLYTASTLIIIDGTRNQDQMAATIAQLTFDSGAIDSQVEVLSSDSVALRVVKTLHLDTDPEFNSSTSGIIGVVVGVAKSVLDIKSWFVSTGASDVADQERQSLAALRKLETNLQVTRIGRSYVLSIDYTSPNPKKAATISNAYAEAYFSDQLQAKFDETKRASGWLEDRIQELRQQSVDSDMAVQRFMAGNGLIAADGKFVADQQLTEITSQLSQAHADSAKAEARLQQINQAIKAGRIDASVGESLDNPVVNDLRTKFLTASKSEAELRQKLGPNHYQVLSLQKDMAQYERLIFDELQRVAETYSADLDVARSKEKSLNESMGSLIGQKAISDETMVQLRELQREAETYKNLYQTFLRRYHDAVQRMSFPSSEARTISTAAVPTVPSSPKTMLVLALAAVMGTLGGGALGTYRENKDHVFRTNRQVREDLELNLIGMVEIVPGGNRSVEPMVTYPNRVAVKKSILTYATDNPLSPIAEVLRAAKVEADLAIKNKPCSIIGVLSALPDEGKTTTAKNLASVLASNGSRTLLIDGDLRNPGLTRQVAQHATVGLLEVLSGQKEFADCLMTEEETGLMFLPAVVKKRISNSAELLSSDAMETLLNQLGKYFEYIIVDLPPIGPVIDVRASARLFDGFLMVVTWGKTPRSLVKSVIADDPLLYDRCFGVILNKTNRKRMRLYQNEDFKGYYYGSYGGYYFDGVGQKKRRKPELVS